MGLGLLEGMSGFEEWLTKLVVGVLRELGRGMRIARGLRRLDIEFV